MIAAQDLAMWKRYRDSGDVPGYRKRKRDYLAGIEQGRRVEQATATMQRLIDMAEQSPDLFALFRTQHPDTVRQLIHALR